MSADPFLVAVAEMEAEFPGYFVEAVHPSSSWSNRGPNGETKLGAGSYRRFYADAWGVTVQQEGWENEADHYVEWDTTPLEALAAVVKHMRQRRDDPHTAHIEDKVLATSCDGCIRDATEIFEIPLDELPVDLEA